MDLDHPPRPGHALIAHLRRHPFLYVSVLLHAVPLAMLHYQESARLELTEQNRQQQLIASGARLTEQARLEKRVHDMARIKSLLAADAGTREAREAGTHKPGQDKDKDSEAQFSSQPKASKELLAQAQELSRAIEKIERENKAAELAKLLDISKQQALERLAPEPRKNDALSAVPRNGAEAAAQIEQLEARANTLLEQRRQQLAHQQSGTPVAGAGKQGDGGQGGQGGAGGGNTRGAPGSSILERIDAFNNPDLPDQSTQHYTTAGLRDFFDHGVGSAQDVDASTMVKGAGRMIGTGGAYANRVYVNRWYLIGPFDGKHGEGLFANARHPPEQAVVLDAVYRGKNGRLLNWEYVNTARYPMIPSVAAEDAVYYGYTELMSDREQNLTLWVGADDDAQLWLNDRLVWQGGNINKQWFFNRIYNTPNTDVRDYNLSEGKRMVRIKKGRNKLFFKLSNGPTRLFVSVVLTK